MMTMKKTLKLVLFAAVLSVGAQGGAWAASELGGVMKMMSGTLKQVTALVKNHGSSDEVAAACDKQVDLISQAQGFVPHKVGGLPEEAREAEKAAFVQALEELKGHFLSLKLHYVAADADAVQKDLAAIQNAKAEGHFRFIEE